LLLSCALHRLQPEPNQIVLFHCWCKRCWYYSRRTTTVLFKFKQSGKGKADKKQTKDIMLSAAKQCALWCGHRESRTSMLFLVNSAMLCNFASLCCCMSSLNLFMACSSWRTISRRGWCADPPLQTARCR
jgi:hypothetical protein